MKDLIHVLKNNAVVSSRDVAENFGKNHKGVLRNIRKILAAQNCAAKTEKMFFESTYEDRGKEYPVFYMNRSGFSLVVMSFTGEKALEWKVKYIEAFDKMERLLMERDTPEWKETRAFGKAVRRRFTDTIQKFKELAEAQGHNGTAKFAYMNFSKMVKSHFGDRDLASGEQLVLISATEYALDNTLSPLVDSGADAKEIFGICKERSRSIVGVLTA